MADEEGELLFTSDENTMNHVVDAHGPNTIRVRVSPLDAIVKDRRPSVLKIDVEGFETRVLAGAGATLSHSSLHSVIMELNGSGARYGFDEQNILDTMEKLGFSPYRYEPFARLLQRSEGGKSRSGNTLFVRDLDLVQRRIGIAPPVTVDGAQL